MAKSDESMHHIGKNVRSARMARNKSLEVVAGLVGKSPAWLSLIENGKARLEKRSDIAALAKALDVAATDLLGGPAPAVPFPANQGAPPVRLREALLDTSLENPLDIPARPLDVLATEWVGPALIARQRSDHHEIRRLVTAAIAELHVHAAAAPSPDRETALRLLVDVCGVAALHLRDSGWADLAWIAADRADSAARVLDDEVWRGAATFYKAHCRTSADQSRASRSVSTMADKIETGMGDDRTAHEVYGMLRLSASLCSQVAGDRPGAVAHAEEAARTASRTGERAGSWQWFGPANVLTWRTLLAVEAGEPGRALDYASQVVPDALPSRARLASLAIDRARAYAMLDRTPEAVAELYRAEKVSIPRTHNNPLVRDMVAHLMPKVGRNATGRNLRALAWRMGIVG